MTSVAFKKQYMPKHIMRHVAIRDNYTCQICGKIGIPRFYTAAEKGIYGYGYIMFEIDHIHPEFLGGKTEEANLQLLCRACNRSKGISNA